MERIFGEHALLHIGRHKPPRVIAAKPVGHLRQVVCPKAEERTMRCDFTGTQGCTRRFDHDTQPVGKCRPAFIAHGGRDLVDAGLDQFDLALGRHQRDHDFGHHRVAIPAGLDRGFENRTGLHLIDFGHGDAQTHAAQTQHRVVFRHRFDPAGHIRQRQIQRFGQIALA